MEWSFDKSIFNWIYWGDIGSSPNHKVSSVQLNKTSSEHCIMSPLPQAVSLCPPLLLFAHLHLPPSHLSLWPSLQCCPCLRLIHECSLTNPFTFFHPVPPLPLPLQSPYCCVCPWVLSLFIFVSYSLYPLTSPRAVSLLSIRVCLYFAC